MVKFEATTFVLLVPVHQTLITGGTFLFLFLFLAQASGGLAKKVPYNAVANNRVQVCDVVLSRFTHIYSL